MEDAAELLSADADVSVALLSDALETEADDEPPAVDDEPADDVVEPQPAAMDAAVKMLSIPANT